MIYLEITKNTWIWSHEKTGFTGLTLKNPYDPKTSLEAPPAPFHVLLWTIRWARAKVMEIPRYGEMGLNSGYIMDELWIYYMDIYICVYNYIGIYIYILYIYMDIWKHRYRIYVDMDMGSSYLWHDHMEATSTDQLGPLGAISMAKVLKSSHQQRWENSAMFDRSKDSPKSIDRENMRRCCVSSMACAGIFQKVVWGFCISGSRSIFQGLWRRHCGLAELAGLAGLAVIVGFVEEYASCNLTWLGNHHVW